MIITVQKSLDDVQKMLKPFEKIFVIGCGTCCTTCKTGGEEQVKAVAGKLTDKKIVGTAVVEAACDARLLRRDTSKLKKEIDEADALLCLTCGAGVQNVADHIDKICAPGLDTKFLGKIERIGAFYEKCRTCGECVLFETGGVCPIVRCPKSMLNGPCGGMYDGKCEVGGYKHDCAWVLIYDRMKKLRMMDILREYKAPRDNSKLNVEPREVVWVGKQTP